MQSPVPIDSASVQHVVMYLKACNKMFEPGILEKKGFIKSTRNPVLSSIKDGFKYFSEWADKAIDEGNTFFVHCVKIKIPYHLNFLNVGYSLSQTSDCMFLSWQTWDLLRFMHYGFVGFCEEFTRKHPGYTIYPIRFNGSAMETLFSHFKYASGRNLMPTNYASARASVLIKGSVSGKHKGDDYRDAPLFVRQHILKKGVK